MARIRSIKPEFWTSEQVAECSPNARLMFIGMWNFCDDYGVIPASFKRLKMQLFPADDAITSDDIRRMIAELRSNDLIQEYTVDSKDYWYVTGWDSHQKPDCKTGLYPRPDGQVGQKIRRKHTEDSPNDRRPFAQGEGEGEGKGEVKAKVKKPVSTPDGFDEFWSAYPRKVKKSSAESVWKKLRPDDSLLKTILTSLETFKRSADWLKDGGAYIPHPTSWLNQQRWTDEMSVSVSTSQDSIFARAIN